MSTVTEQVQQLGQRWADAELNGDVDALDALTTPDFTLVGPLGFVLPKEQWLERHRPGLFRAQSLTWTEVGIREYGDTAVAIGVQEQKAEYQGRPAGGTFRTTHIAVKVAGQWRLAGMHVSPIAVPPQIREEP
jgi:ketosteroid isomerase-like protein